MTACGNHGSYYMQSCRQLDQTNVVSTAAIKAVGESLRYDRSSFGDDRGHLRPAYLTTTTAPLRRTASPASSLFSPYDITADTEVLKCQKEMYLLSVVSSVVGLLKLSVLIKPACVNGNTV